MSAAGKAARAGPAGPLIPGPRLRRTGGLSCGSPQLGGRRGSPETTLWPLLSYCLRKRGRREVLAPGAWEGRTSQSLLWLGSDLSRQAVCLRPWCLLGESFVPRPSIMPAALFVPGAGKGLGKTRRRLIYAGKK